MHSDGHCSCCPCTVSPAESLHLGYVRALTVVSHRALHDVPPRCDFVPPPLSNDEGPLHCIRQHH